MDEIKQIAKINLPKLDKCKNILVLTSAVLCKGITIITQLAVAAALALCVVQTFEADACACITRSWVHHVDVVTALAGTTLSTSLMRVSIVAWRTLITPCTYMKQSK